MSQCNDEIKHFDLLSIVMGLGTAMVTNKLGVV